MKSNKVNKKGIKFLLLLIISASFLTVVAGKINTKISVDKSKGSVEEVAEVCTTCGDNNKEVIVEEKNEYQVYELTKSETVTLTEGSSGEVKGLFSANCDDESYVNSLSSAKRLCSSGSGELDYTVNGSPSSSGGSVKVDKDAEFELVEITYPLAFWLGQYVMENSNREAKTYDPAYSSSGEQIDLDYQAKTLSPQESKEFASAVSGTERENFLVKAGLSVSGADKVYDTAEGEYILSNAINDPKCACSEEVSSSDYNPGKSNKIASNLKNGGYWRQQIPGGDNYENDLGNDCLQEGKDYEDNQYGNIIACKDLGSIVEAKFSGLFSAIFDMNKWEECTEGRTECYTDDTGISRCETITGTCIETENLGVQMTPIFGDPYECEDDLCANAFLTYSYKGSLTPQQASNKKVSATNNDDSLMFFIATPCKAVVDSKGKSQLIDVKCLWDASPTLMNYKLQAKDKAPNQEDFPETFERYWNTVKIAIQKSATYYGL